MTHPANERARGALCDWLDDSNTLRVARLTDSGRSTWYGWMEGRYPVPAYAPTILYPHQPNVEAFSRVMGFQDLGLMLTPVPTAEGTEELRGAALALAEVAGKLAAIARSVTQSDSDGGEAVTKAEFRVVDVGCNEVARAVELVRHIARGGECR